MSFRTGERGDGSKYKYPIRPTEGTYSPKELDVIKIEHRIPDEIDLSDPGLRIYEDVFQKDLPSGSGFVDYSIAESVSRINRAGYQTDASCSGMNRDHLRDYVTGHNVYTGNYAYLSIELPESVATWGITGGAHDVPENTIYDKEYIKRIFDAAERAGWVAELSRYMFVVPGVRLSLPDTKDLESHRRMKSESELVEVQDKMDRVMERERRGDHSLGRNAFLDTLHERDDIELRLREKYDARRWSDEEILNAWNRLAEELERA